MTTTSAPTYYHMAVEKLRYSSLPIKWFLGDGDEPVATFELDLTGLRFIASLIRSEASTDGMAGELQAISERVDRLIAGLLREARGNVLTAKAAEAEIIRAYGVPFFEANR